MLVREGCRFRVRKSTQVFIGGLVWSLSDHKNFSTKLQSKSILVAQESCDTVVGRELIYMTRNLVTQESSGTRFVGSCRRLIYMTRNKNLVAQDS